MRIMHKLLSLQSYLVDACKIVLLYLVMEHRNVFDFCYKMELEQ